MLQKCIATCLSMLVAAICIDDSAGASEFKMEQQIQNLGFISSSDAQATKIGKNNVIAFDKVSLPFDQDRSMRVLTTKYSLRNYRVAAVNPQNIPPVSKNPSSRPRRGITLKFALITLLLLPGQLSSLRCLVERSS